MHQLFSATLRPIRQDWRAWSLTCLLLALGVGGTTAVFGAVQAILWAAPPFPEADALVVLETEDRSTGTVTPVSYPDFEELRDSETLAASAMSGPVRLTFNHGAEPTSLVGEYVSGAYFELLGTTALVGRTFTRAELDVRGAAASVMMISEAAWRGRFGSDPDIVGTPATTSQGVFTIVGVLPSTFVGLIGELCLVCDSVGFVLPGSATSLLLPGVIENRRQRSHYVVARVRNGVAISSVAAQLATRAEAIAAANPATNKGLSVRVTPIGESWRGPVRPMLGMLSIGAALLLVVAMVNVACLMLVQAERRSRSIAVRIAMGANTRSLLGSVLVEVGLMSAVATALGFVIATALLSSTIVLDVPNYVDLRIGWSLLLSAGLATLLVCLPGAIAPVLRALRADLGRELATGSRSVIGVAFGKWSKAVIAIEVGMAFVLLVAAALLLQSYQRLREADAGFERTDLEVFEVNPGGPSYRIPDAQMRFIRALSSSLDTGPLAGRVTIAGPHLPPRTTVRTSVQPVGAPLGTADGTLAVATHRVLPTFFDVLGIPLIEGRTFSSDADVKSDTAVIVSKSLGTRLWPGQSALGRRLVLPRIRDGVGVVIGVAGDVAYAGILGGRPVDFDLYLSLLQAPIGYLTVAARGPDTATVAVHVRNALNQVDGALPILAKASVAERFNAQGRDLETGAQLVALFAAVATLLAAGGVFGVMAIWVERRRAEIALRLALGAAPGRVRVFVVGQASAAVGVGLVLGLLGSWAGTSLLQHLLFDIEPSDPRTFILITIGVMLIAAVTVLPAAVRASRTEVASLLR